MVEEAEAVAGPTRRKRILRAAAIVVVLWSVAWIGANLSAPWALRAGLPTITARLADRGIHLTDATFDGVYVSPWFTSVSVTGAKGYIDLEDDGAESDRSFIVLNDVRVGLENPISLSARFDVHGCEAQLHRSDIPRNVPFESMTDASISMSGLPITDPSGAARMVRERLRDLVAEEKEVADIRLEGEVEIRLGRVRQPARLYSVPATGGYRLRFDEEDIKALADAVGVALTEEEILLIARYPLRVPRVVEATEKAEALSKQHVTNDVWLRDAHRHVTWSYLLTREFGAEFAQLVTDAHETTSDNTADERAMDYHNNAVGRQLFAEGVVEAELPEIVLESDRVIRDPADVKRRAAGELLR